LIPDKVLQKGIKRFGTESVLEVLRILKREFDGTKDTTEALRAKEFFVVHQTANGTWRSESDRGQIARFLLQDRAENLTEIQVLVAEINGVSEPATVPLQTPRARVTPETGVNGKS